MDLRLIESLLINPFLCFQPFDHKILQSHHLPNRLDNPIACLSHNERFRSECNSAYSDSILGKTLAYDLS